MSELILLLIFNSLFIIGFHLSTQEGEVNAWVDNLCHNLPEYIKKPLYDCPTCMASVHSTYIYWYNYELNLHNALVYIIYVFGLSALNTLINSCIEYYRTNIK